MSERGEDAFLVLELRVRECERRMALFAGRTSALEHAVRALVASSSSPTALRVAWADLRSMVVENQAAECGEGKGDYFDGLRQGLKFVTEQIEVLTGGSCSPRR